MQDNSFFFFRFCKPPHAPTGTSSLMWIQMPQHTVGCKDIEFLWGTSALRNLILTEFVILLTLAQGRWFERNFIAHMCNLAWVVSIQYRFGADGVLWPLSMCQYCHWVNSSAQPRWNCWTAELVLVCRAHEIIFAALCLLHHWCSRRRRLWKILHYLFRRDSVHVWNRSLLYEISFYVLRIVGRSRFVCMYVFNELFVFVCWLSLCLSA